MTRRLFLLIAAFFFIQTGHGTEEVFSTIGSEGERAYSDKPLPDSERIELRANKPREEEAAAETQPAFEELSPCEQARFIVARYEDSEQLAEKTEDGSTRVLSDAERLEMIEKARDDERRLCGDEDEN